MFMSTRLNKFCSFIANLGELVTPKTSDKYSGIYTTGMGPICQRQRCNPAALGQPLSASLAAQIMVPGLTPEELKGGKRLGWAGGGGQKN